MLLPGLFPGGRRGAVSLTYDDGYAEQLDHAIPDLDAAGLRATFYIHTGPRSPTLHTRTGEWRAAVSRGHEVGNHTVHHPCSCAHPWVKPNFSLEAYSLQRMESELLEASRTLDDLLGEQPARSYAYTCYEDFVGPERESYRPMVARLFPAARGGPPDNRVPLIDPMKCDFASLPSWSMGPAIPIEAVLAHIDAAITRGRWAILTLHGVGGGHYLNMTRDDHRTLLRHIAERSDALYCDTLLKVAGIVRDRTSRPY